MVTETQLTMTNSDFLAEVYGDLAPSEFGWVTTFRADPGTAPPSVWQGRFYKGTEKQANLIDQAGLDNCYFCTGILKPTDDGEFLRRKDAFERLSVLVLDDVPIEDVDNCSYALQTSPGKHQVGIFLDPDDKDCYDRALIDRVMSSLAARGRSNDASGNACVRYVRLPVGTNTKPRAAGPWQVQLVIWAPRVRWTLADACAAVGIDLDSLRMAAAIAKTSTPTTHTGTHAGEMIAGITGPLEERAYHDNLTRLAASLVSGGMYAGAAVEFLYSLMDQAKPDMRQEEELRRWEVRRAEIPRAVKSAEKFAPEERKPPQITVNLNLADEDTGSSREPSSPGELAPLDWSALEGTEPEPTSWRVDGWLPERTVTLLAANGGVGKSNLSLQMGVALAQGLDFLGLQTKPSRVLVISGEDEGRTVHFRVANICKDLGVSVSELDGRMIVYDMTQTDCVLWRDGAATERMQWLADAVVRHRADVVVIDNASDVFADNENDRTAVRGFMRCLNMIAGHTSCAMLLLAHVDKASVRVGAGNESLSTYSGSTAWNNSARSRWAMVRNNDREILLRHEKCNLGPLQEELRLEFDTGSKTFKRFGTIPGTQAVATLMRNQHRAVILKMIGRAASAGINLSMKLNAASANIYNVLKDEPEMPRIDRKEFFALVYDLEREQLIKQEQYKKANRMPGQRVVLTEAGQTRVALGSGAGPTWAQREEE
jgi:archaellum biogenesis ATPase FlaH